MSWSVVSDGGAIALAVLLAIAATAKLVATDGAAAALRALAPALGTAPAVIRRGAVRAIAAVEMATAVLLVVCSGRSRLLVAAATSILFSVFLGITAHAVRNRVGCGCFGSLSRHSTGRRELARAAVLAAVAWTALVSSLLGPPLGVRITAPALAVATLILGFAVGVTVRQHAPASVAAARNHAVTVAHGALPDATRRHFLRTVGAAAGAALGAAVGLGAETFARPLRVSAASALRAGARLLAHRIDGDAATRLLEAAHGDPGSVKVAELLAKRGLHPDWSRAIAEQCVLDTPQTGELTWTSVRVPTEGRAWLVWWPRHPAGAPITAVAWMGDSRCLGSDGRRTWSGASSHLATLTCIDGCVAGGAECDGAIILGAAAVAGCVLTAFFGCPFIAAGVLLGAGGTCYKAIYSDCAECENVTPPANLVVEPAEQVASTLATVSVTTTCVSFTVDWGDTTLDVLNGPQQVDSHTYNPPIDLIQQYDGLVFGNCCFGCDGLSAFFTVEVVNPFGAAASAAPQHTSQGGRRS